MGGRKVGEQLVTRHLRRSLKCLLSPCCCTVSQRLLQAAALRASQLGLNQQSYPHTHTHSLYLSSSLSFNPKHSHIHVHLKLLVLKIYVSLRSGTDVVLCHVMVTNPGFHQAHSNLRSDFVNVMSQPTVRWISF